MAWKTEDPNQTEVSYFFLESLMYTAEHPSLFFLLFFIIYAITVTGNLLILLTVGSDPHLSSPMYHFLGHLSFLDACLSTVTVPKVMAGLLTLDGKVITFEGCVVQLYCFHFLASTECFLYTVMAYDRYLAICQPLHYPVAMNRQMCAGLAGITWATGAVHSAIHTFLTFRLHYCGPDHIDYFFCDIPPVLKLACADTTINELAMLVNIGVVAAGCLILITISYVFIIAAVLRIRSSASRQRAFSTCSSHLTVVLLYYMPPVCIYLQPSSSEVGAGTPAVFYTMITPMLNPFIYTLRNKEVKRALRRLLSRGSPESPAGSPSP
ncbi:PREDICTED: LOW QUALITY PROTEIN: olfactory receptor 10S1-like [Condylura cristata]|uniref:LOW QUALITY PROTEIN: olfactory receptor 10S1-like n=1 Tax=Condylura cristata TaxID=143302 RepID=UPI000642E96A|nr:PREDICTED: LOW QUALITY PROTEIN: olfactory receptor 10S1-like [Condylura cristata]